MSVVFPLYGCETGKKNHQKTEGLNSLQKSKMHPDVSGCSERPIKCGLNLSAGARLPLPLWCLALGVCLHPTKRHEQKVRSDSDACPVSHQLQGMASRGKFPLRGTNCGNSVVVLLGWFLVLGFGLVLLVICQAHSSFSPYEFVL